MVGWSASWCHSLPSAQSIEYVSCDGARGEQAWLPEESIQAFSRNIAWTKIYISPKFREVIQTVRNPIGKMRYYGRILQALNYQQLAMYSKISETS
jgi:hypothetical protein